MNETGESLDPVRIRRRLQSEIGLILSEKFDLRVVSETGSTNDDLLQLGAAGEREGLVLFAEGQSAGRGRRGDAWVSPPGLNLLFSILLRPEFSPERWSRIPHLAAVAICLGIENAVPEFSSRCRIKWPNDIYLADRKLAGILIESRSRSPAGGPENPVAVLGIGLNVNVTGAMFPEALRPLAISLRDQAGHILSRNEIAGSILAEWAAVYPSGIDSFDSIRQEMEQRSLLLKRKIIVTNGPGMITGRLREFGENGEMIVEEENGRSVAIRSADLVRLAPEESS